MVVADAPNSPVPVEVEPNALVDELNMSADLLDNFKMQTV